MLFHKHFPQLCTRRSNIKVNRMEIKLFIFILRRLKLISRPNESGMSYNVSIAIDLDVFVYVFLRV